MNILPDHRGHPPTAEDVPWRERAAFTAAVVIVLLLSWWWIVAMARDMYGAMTGPSAWMMTSVWDGTHLLLLWTMWAVMMAAMMLPSAWPMLVMYAHAVAQSSHPARQSSSHLYLFAGGYVLVWALFSVAATIVQRLLARLLLLSPMMETDESRRKRRVAHPRGRLSVDAAQARLPPVVPLSDFVSARALAAGAPGRVPHGHRPRRSTAWAAAGR